MYIFRTVHFGFQIAPTGTCAVRVAPTTGTCAAYFVPTTGTCAVCFTPTTGTCTAYFDPQAWRSTVYFSSQAWRRGPPGPNAGPLRSTPSVIFSSFGPRVLRHPLTLRRLSSGLLSSLPPPLSPAPDLPDGPEETLRRPRGDREVDYGGPRKGPSAAEREGRAGTLKAT